MAMLRALSRQHWAFGVAALGATGAGTLAFTGYAYSEAPPAKKEKLVVLGSGWGAVALLKNIDPAQYDVSVVSPRNYFLNTAMLPGVTVGTVEARSVIEPVRRLLPGTPGQSTFYEAAAVSVDTKKKTVTCRDVSGITAKSPEFSVPYDRLIVSIGAPCNTFGTPGVREHTTFLKEVDDALGVRHQLMDLFETASLPGCTSEEVQRMCSVVVVGGGPTGVEFAAELHDFLSEDMPRLYPALKDKISITLVQSADHILNMYDERISKYAEQKFARDGIKVLTGRRVTEVRPSEVVTTDKKTKAKEALPFGVCVWSTGLGAYPLTSHLQQACGQPKRRALAVDSCLRVRGAEGIYAMGDCADVKSGGKELLDHAKELFAQADTDRSGAVDQEEFARLLADLQSSYPQVGPMLKRGRLAAVMEKADDDKSGALSLKEFEKALAEADARLTSHPATAQVANQQGIYLAGQLNAAAREGKKEPEPFQYRHLGSFATLGGEHAAVELPGDFVSTGISTMALWYGVYFSEQVSWRNRFLVAGDWVKKAVWGRDPSRI